MKMRIFLTTCVAGLVCAPALAAAPAADAGPWAKVPALPTACFSSQDPWLEKNDAAIEAVQQDRYKQEEANAAIAENYQKAQEENPMAVAQAMQQAMMDDPQNAQKYLEQLTQQGQAAQAEAPAQNAKEQQLEAESKTVMQQYQAALAKASGAAEARWNALKQKRGYDPQAKGPGESGEPDWVYTEWNAVLRERDAAYVSNCGQWWAAGSPIHAYLQRYKDFLVQERTPARTKFDGFKLDQYRLLNVSTDGYRSTEEFDAANLYMKRAREMFGERRTVPRCPSADRCDAIN